MPYNLIFKGFDRLGPVQVDVLDSLDTRPMVMAELCDDTGRHKSPLKQALDRLLERGVVYRRKVPKRAASGPRHIWQYHIDWSYLE